MNKGLDLIKRQQPEIIDGFPTGNIFIGVTKEELTELEEELKDYEYLKQSNEELQKLNTNYGKRIDKLEKRLEIIKEKAVNLYYVEIVNNYINYNRCIDEFFGNYEHRDIYYLTQEEFNLLKEVML